VSLSEGLLIFILSMTLGYVLLDCLALSWYRAGNVKKVLLYRGRTGTWCKHKRWSQWYQELDQEELYRLCGDCGWEQRALPDKQEV
jgi:hypothetical protein